VAVFSAFGIFLLAFPHAIAFALEEGNVGVVGESVEKSGNAGSVWKNGVPVLEGKIGGEDDGTPMLVTLIDDMVEEVGGVLVIGEISELIDGKELWAKVLSKTAPTELRGITVEIVEKFGDGLDEYGVAFEQSLVSDVFEEHGFAESVGAEDEEVSALSDELETECGLDESAVDFLGPVPIEVSDGLEPADLGALESAFEASAGFVVGLDACEKLELLQGGEPVLGGASEEVVEIIGESPESESEKLPV